MESRIQLGGAAFSSRKAKFSSRGLKFSSHDGNFYSATLIFARLMVLPGSAILKKPSPVVIFTRS
jgi:hypothetical protein